MTNRARQLMFFGLCGLLAGILRGQAVLSLLSLATFVWLLSEWFRFQARIRIQLPSMEFERLVNGMHQTTSSLWAGRKAHIEIRMRSKYKLTPLVQIRDVVPGILELLGTETEMARHDAPDVLRKLERPKSIIMKVLSSIRTWLGSFAMASSPRSDSPNQWLLEQASRECRFSYQVMPRSAGQAKMPGIRLTFQDEHRFFRFDRFVELAQSVRILPDFYQSGELRPTIKRQNSLPRQGIHRLQRAGAGSELLELREYVAGDPPKSIAWKASARRDKLMTRKYESEVPVRVHLLVDGSASTRVGGFGFRLLDQINFVAASIAKAGTAVGDPISGVLVNETVVQRLPWLAGDRGFLRLLQALSDFAQLPPAWSGDLTQHMMHSATRVCHERYPELLDRRYHPIPFSFFLATRERFRMAGVLAEQFQLSPRVQVECCYDNATMAFHLQQFLFQAGLPVMSPLLPELVDPVVASEKRMQSIADAMSRAIAHARDNEVFVVLADLVSCAPNMTSLMRVVKLAKGKHHRVAFVCPTTTFMRPTAELVQPQSNRIEDLLLASEKTRIRDLAAEMKRELVRLGVPVAFSGEQSAIQTVLAEIDLARDGKGRMSMTSQQGSRR